MKISHDDRLKLKLWLEKDPSSRGGKSITVNDRLFHRRTEYFGAWKVRIAYDANTNYPLIMSSPIPAEQDSNKQDVAPKVMVAKLPAKKSPALTLKAKPKGKSYLEEITSPNPNYVTFKVHADLAYAPMPFAVTYKAVKGSKAIYSGWTTFYVLPDKPIPYQYWKNNFKQATVPVGYFWKNLLNSDALALVKK